MKLELLEAAITRLALFARRLDYSKRLFNRYSRDISIL